MEGFYESFLIFSYLIISAIIVSNMVLAVFLDVWSSSSGMQRHEELLQNIQSSAAATASALAVLQAKSSSADYSRTKMDLVSSPSLKSRRASSIAASPPIGYDRSPPLMHLDSTLKLPASASLRSATAPAASAAAAADDAGVVLRRIGPWREMQTSDGDVYYWNKFTGVVTWTHPKKLSQEVQNPAVTSVAAALHRMKAREMKFNDQGHGDDVSAGSNATGSGVASVRTPAELRRLPTTDEHDADGYDSPSRHDSTQSGPSTSTAASLAGVLHGADRKQLVQDANKERETSSVKKKLSVIQMWCVRVRS